MASIAPTIAIATVYSVVRAPIFGKGGLLVLYSLKNNGAGDCWTPDSFGSLGRVLLHLPVSNSQKFPQRGIGVVSSVMVVGKSCGIKSAKHAQTNSADVRLGPAPI
ncbi:hypothetical protein C8F04DRAFT_1177065 [Mycena alexandri]|uniref:Uncharacterized protein n=1 Tax=Mycena alexandri TaxID=1745969 RepID=A0AAD6T9G2_9AGAR|nr:hypothetical protein C8F04DRAFT_1177065 [Mycena alexandri]